MQILIFFLNNFPANIRKKNGVFSLCPWYETKLHLVSVPVVLSTYFFLLNISVTPKIKMAFSVSHPGMKPNCISSIHFLLYHLNIYQISSESELLISVPYSFFFLNHLFFPYDSS